jgi:hypothetical protein
LAADLAELVEGGGTVEGGEFRGQAVEGDWFKKAVNDDVAEGFGSGELAAKFPGLRGDGR